MTSRVRPDSTTTSARSTLHLRGALGVERFRTAGLFLAMADVQTDKTAPSKVQAPLRALDHGPIEDLAVENVMGPAPKVD